MTDREDGKLPEPFVSFNLVRQLIYLEPGDYYTADQMRAYAAQATAAERERLNAIRNTVRNDYWAVSFQTMGQYRTALLRAIDEIRKG